MLSPMNIMTGSKGHGFLVRGACWPIRILPALATLSMILANASMRDLESPARTGVLFSPGISKRGESDQSAGNREEAEKLIRQTITRLEAERDPANPELATQLNRLTVLLLETGRVHEAEVAARRALSIQEANLSPDHPSIAISLGNLAGVLQKSGASTEAETLLRRALRIDEKSFGLDHPNVARDLNNLSVLVWKNGQPAEAEQILRRVIAICETSFGTDHPSLDAPMHNLAQLLVAKENLPEAEAFYRKRYAVMANYEKLTRRSHPRWNEHLQQHAALLDRLGACPQELQEQLLAFTRKSFGPAHLYVAAQEMALGRFFTQKLESALARPHLEAALRICEQHPEGRIPARITQVILAAAWREIGDVDRARALLAHVVADWETERNPNRLAVGQAAFEMALCDFRSGRFADAEKWIRKSLDSFQQGGIRSEAGEAPMSQAIIAYLQILRAQGKSAQEIRQQVAGLASAF